MEILTEGNKILKQKATKVVKIDDTIRHLCAFMVQTMLKNNGCGLAGNQVGILKRIIIILHDNNPIIMINPEIISFSETLFLDKEGCLSIPGKFIEKNRYSKITIRYRDTKGKPHFENYSGLSARIIQHEIDHLDGILMTDEYDNAKNSFN